jgi:predicted RNA-binding protein Jag
MPVDIACRVVSEERMKEIEAQLAGFVVDESRVEPLVFPPSLPSHERKVVHRLAEEYNLSHESFGLGKDRHIQVLFFFGSSCQACAFA